MFATYHEALKDGVFWKASCQHLRWGVGRAQWLEHWTCDWKVTGSNPCRSDGRILCSRVNFLCWLLFWYLYHPHVTAVAHKRSRSFWQLTAKQACTFVCMTAWSDMMHGCMVYTEWDGSSFMWHQPCQLYKYIIGYSETCYKKLFTHVELRASTVRAEDSTM